MPELNRESGNAKKIDHFETVPTDDFETISMTNYNVLLRFTG